MKSIMNFLSGTITIKCANCDKSFSIEKKFRNVPNQCCSQGCAMTIINKEKMTESVNK